MTIKLNGVAASSAELAGIRSDLEITQLETSQFVQRILDAGGTIDARTIAAADQFVIRGKAGWWAKINEVWPFVGGQLAAATQKLKYDPTCNVPSLTNVGIPESAYHQTTGITNTAPGQYLTTGFNYVTAGLSENNLSIAGSMLGIWTHAGGYTIGTMGSPGVDTPIRLSSISAGLVSPSMGIGTLNYAAKILGASYSTGTTHNFKQNGLNAYTAATAHSGTGIDAELNVFRCVRYATTYYENTPLGLVALGSYLTPTEHSNLQRAMIEFEIAVGRIAWTKYPSSLCLVGDSVTSGQGATTMEKTFARMIQLRAPSVFIIGHNSATLSQQVSEDYGLNNVSGYVLMLASNDLGIDSSPTGNTTLINAAKAKVAEIATQCARRGKSLLICSAQHRTSVTEATARAWAVGLADTADTLGNHYLDLDRLLRDATVTVMSDTSHPNDLGHAMIANAILEAMQGRFTRSPVVDVGNVTAGSSVDTTVECLSADVGDRVTVQADALEVGLIARAWVSADREITLRLSNVTGSDINPASQTFRFTVSK